MARGAAYFSPFSEAPLAVSPTGVRRSPGLSRARPAAVIARAARSLLVALAAVLAACGGSAGPGSETPGPSVTEPAARATLTPTDTALAASGSPETARPAGAATPTPATAPPTATPSAVGATPTAMAATRAPVAVTPTAAATPSAVEAAPAKPGAAAPPVATGVARSSGSAARGPGSESETVPNKATPTPTPEAAPAVQVRRLAVQAVRSAISGGTVYTWQDGEHTRSVRLVSGLFVQSSGENTVDDLVLTDNGERSIVVRQNRHAVQDFEPVFVSEVGGGLMTLPGGVLLALDPDWGEERVNRFFSENGIKLSRVSAQTFSENAFLVETEPGLPSLELANELATRTGVLISTPNWARQLDLR